MKMKRFLEVLCCALAVGCLMIASAFAAPEASLAANAENTNSSLADDIESARLWTLCYITVLSTNNDAGQLAYTPTAVKGVPTVVRAIPNEGFRLVGWTIDGVFVSFSETYTFTVTGDVTLVAVFAPIGQYCIFDASPTTDGGSIQITPNRQIISPGEYVSVHVTANDGYRVRGVYFSTDLSQASEMSLISNTADASFLMPAKDIVVCGAYYSNTYHTITVDPNITHGTVRLDGNKTSGKYRQGDKVTVTFVADEGYHLTEITGIGQDYVFSGNTFTFSMLNKDFTISATFEKNQSYSVAFAVSPAGSGTVDFVQDSVTKLVTATATAYEGFEFIGWYEKGSEELLCDTPAYVFGITHATTYVARFKALGYRVYVSGLEENGTVSTEKQYYKAGETVRIIATPDEGYMVNHYYWGALDSTGHGTMSPMEEDSFTMPDSIVAISASFVKAYIITVTGNNSAVTGAGQYKENSFVTLNAGQKEGYVFCGWKENGTIVSTDATYRFWATANRTLEAVYVPVYSVTYDGEPEHGTVTGCGTGKEGDKVVLTATPDPGYHFVSWRLTTPGGMTKTSTANPYTFTLNVDYTVTATFAPNENTITATASPAAGGTVTGAGTYLTGETVTLTAAAKEGYTFTCWKKNGTQVSTNANYTFTAAENGAYTAFFEINKYTVSASANPAAGGTVTGGGSFSYGSSATVKATPKEGYRFVNWTSNGTAVSTQAEYTFNVTANVSLTANFTKLTYSVSATVEPANCGTVTGTGTYEWGSTARLHMEPVEGYSFTGWKVDGKIVSNEDEYSFVVKKNCSVIATFEKIVHQAFVIIDPENAGTVSGSNLCEWGGSTTLKATANNGYVFVGWKENGEIVCTSAEYTFSLEEDTMLEACFEEAPAVEYTVTYDANGAACAVPAPVKVIEGESTVIPAATMAREGYYFMGWATSATAATAQYKRGNSLTVTGNITLYAVWKKQSFKLTFDANGGNGSVAAITALYGATVTIPKATLTREGHYFMGWAESATATTAQYKTGNTLTLTGAKTLYAVWKKQSFKLTFNANGGKGSVAAITALYGATVTIPKASLTREGYYFMGWAESATATAVQYKTGNTLTLTGAKTLYAVWKAQTRKLTFDANGGTGTLPATVSVAYGTEATVGKGSLSREGYYFMGWATTKTATAAEYKTNSTIVLTDNVTLYAVWKVQTKKLSFNVNGGTGTLPATVTVNYGETAKVGKASVSREGYYFLGWATTQNATASQYKTGSEIVMTADTVLYAVWKKK